MRHKNLLQAQTLVEFALIIPMFLLLLVGFFDLGRAFFYNSSLSNAVREGTRSGIVLETDETLNDIVIQYAFGLTNTLTADDIDIVIILDGDGYRDTLQITATYCFVPITPMIATLVGSSCAGGGQGIPLNAKSVMQFEPGFK